MLLLECYVWLLKSDNKKEKKKFSRLNTMREKKMLMKTGYKMLKEFPPQIISSFFFKQKRERERQREMKKVRKGALFINLICFPLHFSMDNQTWIISFSFLCVSCTSNFLWNPTKPKELVFLSFVERHYKEEIVWNRYSKCLLAFPFPFSFFSFQ